MYGLSGKNGLWFIIVKISAAQSYLFYFTSVNYFMENITSTNLTAKKIQHLSWSTFWPVKNKCRRLSENAITTSRLKNKAISSLKPLHGFKDTYCLIKSDGLSAEYATYRIIKSSDNFVVIGYDSGSRIIAHYSEHVFIRYCQRLKLKNLSAYEQLRHFLQNATNIPVKYSGCSDNGMQSFEQKWKNGIAYGAVDTLNGICYYRTFYTYNMVHK